MKKITQRPEARLVTLVITLFVLSGCATIQPGKSIQQNNSGIASVRQQPEQHEDADVVWGGSIVGIEIRSGETWIEVVERPLTRRGVPDLGQQSSGRFLAIVPQFLDPLDYSNGRSITITGTINGSESRKIVEADYEYPLVTVNDHHLWNDSTAIISSSRHRSRSYYPYYGYRYSPFHIRSSIFFGHRSRGRFGHGRGRLRGNRGHFTSGSSRF